MLIIKKDTILNRMKRAFNVFVGNERAVYEDVGAGYSSRPDRPRLSRGNERTIMTSILNRIALDVSAIEIKHVVADDNGRYKSVVESSLNRCLTLEANIDQTARAFIHDAALSLMDEGSIAIVPVEATADPAKFDVFDIGSLRVGRITEWYPKHVKVRLYNDETGQQQDIVRPKRAVAVIENPLYAVLNEPNSTMQRLIRKLALLDAIDEQSGSGKLDMIIQLPYVVKSELRREQANNRRKEIEEQLAGSKYGIAWTDGTEKITQLNRPLGNNLMTQIEYLTSTLNSQLGITQSIMDGTADAKTMLNYTSRTVEPIIAAIVDGMKRVFLSEQARSEGETIMYFSNPFRLVPVENIAEIADKFTRNEIMTSNEIRQIIGMLPSTDPNADVLRNKNLSQSKESIKEEMENQNAEK